MRIDLCGVRGSMPAAGAAFARVGGNTSCVAITAHGQRHPHLLLDAGTGLRNVSRLLAGDPFRGSLVLTHLHWDHTQGLPFFTAGDHDGARVDMHLPATGDPAHALDRLMSPPFFPITPSGLRGEWRYSRLDEGTIAVDGLEVVARRLPHPGGDTFGLRVAEGTSSMAYVPDHGPLALGAGPEGWGPYHDDILALVDGVDVLLHDAQLVPADLPAKAEFGHSTVGYAVELARRAGVGRLLLFHHDPWRTDDEIDAIVRCYATGPVDVMAAVEGDTITL
jgi:phosphoribosyl 1,2-cyclic phosphodiesterase